jgi:type VI secretion system secreted protein VgrG
MIMEAEEASHMRFRGTSQVRALAPGHTFTLEDHPFDEFNIEYMALSVWHHGRNNLTNESAPSDYHNHFSLQPQDVTWRAPLSTPRGHVRGPQTALVTGPAGEEIHTDEHGRIKVQFHWDRQGEYNDRSSCWVRVAQMWAGNGYGTMFIPRIGMEVVVDFLEGDPDQPIVTGCVYNGINRPPNPLPQFATRSGIKTLSSKGGGGTNELTFEDKKGEEQVFLQAEKDLNVNVKNNHTQTIGADSDHHIIGNSRHTVDGNRDMKVTGHAYSVATGDYVLGSEADLQLAAENEARLISRNRLLIATGMGGNMDIHGGLQLAIEANTQISLKVGGSGIVIDPSGVSVVGPMIRQNSGGAPRAARSYTAVRAEVASDAHGTSDGSVTDPGQQLQAQALINAALAGQPFCAECEAARAAYQALMA